jgi:D-arabinose 1-dehydrogenase-like Zn-dependent alcohol dehydrogenase
VDVFAKDDETVIVAECKASGSFSRRSLQKDIEEFANLKKPIASAIRRHYGENKKLKIIWLFVTENIIWSTPDKHRATGEQIRIITERELRYYAQVPEGMSSVDAAPLLCAGLTTFSALRNATAKAGDLVAIAGIGGLGHLGIQYARHMGFEVAAIDHGNDRSELAKKLGAHHYIDSATSDPAAALEALGEAQLILVTASSAAVVSQTFMGLRPNGVSVVVGAGPEPIQTSSRDLIFGNRKLEGSLTGNPATGDTTLRFSSLNRISAMIETVPLEQAADAYAKMIAGKARFRMVLTMDNAEDSAKS